MRERSSVLSLAFVLTAVVALCIFCLYAQAHTSNAASCGLSPQVAHPEGSFGLAAMQQKMVAAGALGLVPTKFGSLPLNGLFALIAASALGALCGARLTGGRAPAAYVLLCAVAILTLIFRSSIEFFRAGHEIAMPIWVYGGLWSGVVVFAAASLGTRLGHPSAMSTSAKVSIRAGLIVVALAICGGAIARPWVALTASSKPLSAGEFEHWFAEQARVDVGVSSEGTSVLVLEFIDYQCPPCRQALTQYEPLLKEYEARYPGQIRIVRKDFPLDPACNVGVAHALHAAACDAAAAVRLAAKVGRGDALVNWLFDHQNSLTKDAVWRAAASITGNSAIRDAENTVAVDIRQDGALGHKLGVSGTPTFFINGVRVQGVPAELFAAALDHELGRANKRTEGVDVRAGRVISPR